MKLLKGFSVIELLVVVAVIAVLAVIIVSSLPQAKLQFSLDRVAYDFAQNVRLAQDMALSSVQYKDSQGNVKSISGYGVYVDLSSLGNTKYLVYADANPPGNQQYDASDYTVSTTDFSTSESGIIIKQLNNVTTTNVSMNFNSSNIATNITNLSSGQTSVVVVFAEASNPSVTKTVTINASGLVDTR